MKKFAALLVFLNIVLASYTQNELKVSLSRDSIRVGELSELEWQFSVPSGSKILQMPLVPDSMPSGIEVVERKEIISEKKGGRDLYKQRLSLSAYDSGAFVVPAMYALFQHNADTIELFSDSLLLFCTTVPVDTTSAVKDVKDIYEVEDKPSWHWLWYLLGGVLLVAAGILVYLRLRKRKPAIPEEEIKWINPAEAALTALKKMQETRIWFSTTPKDFYTELVDILRKYLMYSRNIQAEEMLTSELIEAVSLADLSNSAIVNLQGILQVADMAKFARYRPEPGQYEKSVSDAIEFVLETRLSETNNVNNEVDE